MYCGKNITEKKLIFSGGKVPKSNQIKNDIKNSKKTN